MMMFVDGTYRKLDCTRMMIDPDTAVGMEAGVVVVAAVDRRGTPLGMVVVAAAARVVVAVVGPGRVPFETGRSNLCNSACHRH